MSEATVEKPTESPIRRAVPGDRISTRAENTRRSVDTAHEILTDEVLRTLHARASGDEPDGGVLGAVAEDIADLAAAGYLTAALPSGLGGRGSAVDEINREQRTLAYWSPAAARAVTGHLSWIGAAADLYRSGDHRLAWLLHEAASGRVAESVHGASGHPANTEGSVKAVPVDGGYLFSGTAGDTPAAAAWHWLGVYARNDTDPQGPNVVHAFVDRTAAGLHIRGDATQLENVFVAKDKVVETVALGHRPGATARLLPWALTLRAAISLGIGQRALDTATDSARRNTAARLDVHAVPRTSSVQHRCAEARLLLENATAQLDNLTGALARGYVPDDLLATLSAAEAGADRAARQVVDLSLEIAGPSAVHAHHELHRLRRDLQAASRHSGIAAD